MGIKLVSIDNNVSSINKVNSSNSSNMVNNMMKVSDNIEVLNLSDVDRDNNPLIRYNYDDNNNVLGYFFNDSNLYYDMIDDTYKRFNEDTQSFENISIFDEENLPSSQFGADQGSFDYNFTKLIRDPYILEELYNYFPISSFDSYADALDFYDKYFLTICESGCGYAAATNVIFKEYEGREKEFEETFGFPMYTVDDFGNIDFNYEVMMLKIFNYTWARDNSGEDILKENVKRDFLHIFSGLSYDFVNFDDFMKEYGVECTSKEDPCNRFAFWGNDEKNKIIQKELFEKNDYLAYGGSGYDLYTMDGERVCVNGGGHFVLIIGFTDDGMPIVSSWGERYILDIRGDDLKFLQDDDYRYSTVNF